MIKIILSSDRGTMIVFKKYDLNLLSLAVFGAVFILTMLAISPSLFCQIDRREIIVGEVLGKIDPDNLIAFVEQKYYPVADNTNDIYLELREKTSDYVSYRIRYINPQKRGEVEWLSFRFFESERSLAAAIITDQIDFAVTESLEIAEEVDKSNDSVYIRHRLKPANYVKMLAINNKRTVLQNASVRKALALAIDRKYILREILKNNAFYADSPLPKESEFHASEIRDYKYNPREALTLLQSLNFLDENTDGILDKNGVPFKIYLIYEKGVLNEEQIARRIKIDWNKIGVDVTTLPLPKSEITHRLNHRDYDAILMSFEFDPTYECFEKYFRSTSPHNFLGYRSHITDMYLNIYPKQTVQSKQTVFNAIQNQISKDFPAIFLFFPWFERYFVNTSKFENYRSKTIGLLPFTEWEFR